MPRSDTRALRSKLIKFTKKFQFAPKKIYIFIHLELCLATAIHNFK